MEKLTQCLLELPFSHSVAVLLNYFHAVILLFNNWDVLIVDTKCKWELKTQLIKFVLFYFGV